MTWVIVNLIHDKATQRNWMDRAGGAGGWGGGSDEGDRGGHGEFDLFCHFRDGEKLATDAFRR